MTESDLKDFIVLLTSGQALNEQQAYDAFEIIMAGRATSAQIGAFLSCLRIRGETVSEITGGARSLRKQMKRISAPSDAIDTVGTGGDNAGTYNISTASAFVLAGLDVPVAKHGNKSISSKSGAADVLKELGVNIDADIRFIEESLATAKVTFLNAPNHHPAMRHVSQTRIELGVRTIFNLLGPLANPAQVKRQLTGVYAKEWVEPIAKVLCKLGVKHAWVVHGSDGLDEITTTGSTFVAEVVEDRIHTFEIEPADAGLSLTKLDNLRGGNPQENALALNNLLEGKKNPYRDIVLINAAAALIIAGKTNNLKDGVALAANSIDSGKAYRSLKKLVDISNKSFPNV